MILGKEVIKCGEHLYISRFKKKKIQVKGIKDIYWN
jgi:hypothetical protein